MFEDEHDRSIPFSAKAGAEELQTVHVELQQSNNVLTQTGNDLTNLLNCVDIPLLMLDSDLRILRFTPSVRRLLSVRQSDIGRSISEIRLQLSIDNIEPILNEVLESSGTRELEAQDREGRWHLLRVCPYRMSENKIEGVVVVLVDIDQLRRSQQSLVDACDFANSVVESVPVPIVVLDSQHLAIRAANAAFRELTQMQVKDLEGRSLPELAHSLWEMDGLEEKLTRLLSSPPAMLEFEHLTVQRKSLLIKAEALSTDGSKVLLLMIEDITLRRESDRLIAKQKEVLEGTQDELRSLTAHLFTVQEEERQRVARELHDDVSQRLSLLEMLLQEINCASRGADREKLDQARQQLSTLNTDVRLISHRLHPSILSDLGLSAALQSLVKEFGERENMPATYMAQNLPESWPPEAATAIYRITQETLRNVSKHAGKTHVKVILTGIDDSLQLRVTDFGIGFDQEADMPASGLGMISMQERARLAGGTLQVQSALGHGTTIAVDIPIARTL